MVSLFSATSSISAPARPRLSASATNSSVLPANAWAAYKSNDLHPFASSTLSATQPTPKSCSLARVGQAVRGSYPFSAYTFLDRLGKTSRG